MSDSSDDDSIIIEKPKQKKRRVDDSDEEYDDDERRYAKRRKNLGNLILDEAAVDDDEDEEDEYEDDNNLDDMIDNPDEVAEAQDAMQHVKYDNRARQNSLNFENEEEIEEHYRRRYEDDGEDDFGTGSAMANTINQQSLLPGVKDPSMWQIKCFDGEEKNTVLKLMHKYMVLKYSKPSLQILGCLSKDNVKGYIYIEAFKESHVKMAAEGIKSIVRGIESIKMIPIAEMTDVIKVSSNFKKLERGQWVRINKGMYKNDLCKVVSIDESQNTVIVQLIPRIDYKQLANDKGRFIKQKFFVKPFPALLNRKKLAELGLDVQKNGAYYTFRRQDFDEHGFLYKEFKLNFIQADGVKPDMQEIEKFNESITNVNVAKQVKKGLEGVDNSFNIGDQVIVVTGTLKDLRGIVVSIDNRNIIINNKELNQNMSFPPDELRRMFVVGNHVRVLSGQFEGETGIVVNADIHTVVVLSDSNMNQFKVKPMDLSLSASVSSEIPNNQKFSIGDLIQIDPKTVGMVIQFQKSVMKVLTNMNKEMTLDCNSPFAKKNNNKSVTLDSNRQEVRHKDMVDIISGIGSGKQGEIRHVWKGIIFIYNSQFQENRGLIATRGCNVAKRGTVVLSNPTNSSFSNVPQSPRIHSKNHHSNGNHTDRNNNDKSTFKAPHALKNEKKYIGSSVRIIKGPLKGKIGIIKDLKLDAATIELHSEFKSVKVSKENFRICNADGQMIDSAFGTPLKSGYTGGSSAWGGKTPNYGAQTPMYGSNNRFGDGGRTPQVGSVHTPRLGQTGSDTPRAGAFDPVTATPAHFSNHDNDLFNDDDRSDDNNRFSSHRDGKTPTYLNSSTRQPNDNDDDESYDSGNWYSGIRKSPPSNYPQTPNIDPYYAFTPASPGFDNDNNSDSLNHDYSNLEPVPKWHLIRNVEVLVSLPNESIKSGVILRESNGIVTVNVVEEKRIVDVSLGGVFRKEPDSGSNVIYIDPSNPNSETFGKCLSIDNGEVVTKFSDGNLKLLPLKDVVPFFTDEII